MNRCMLSHNKYIWINQLLVQFLIAVRAGVCIWHLDISSHVCVNQTWQLPSGVNECVRRRTSCLWWQLECRKEPLHMQPVYGSLWLRRLISADLFSETSQRFTVDTSLSSWVSVGTLEKQQDDGGFKHHSWWHDVNRGNRVMQSLTDYTVTDKVY